MNAKILFLLLSSYAIYGFLMYVCLKPKDNTDDQTEAKLYSNKIDELLEKLEKNKVIESVENNTMEDILSALNDIANKHSTIKETFYFGKYKTPQRLLNVSKSRCFNSEMDISYFETCHTKYKDYIKSKNYGGVIESLANFMAVEPAVDIGSNCTPPPLPQIKCEDYMEVFGNKARAADKEHKIGILIQLGFDVDMLEVYLWEVYDVVDKFFIIESVVTHSNDQIRKPLMWEKIKDTKRFKRFSDKVVHFVIDDAGRKMPDGNIWSSESNQERLRWEKFKEWNEKNKFFDNGDLIGFGDTDEIPSRDALAVLKRCSGNLDYTDIGLTFFFGTFSNIFKSDFPVYGYPYTLGDPTFFTVKNAHLYNGESPYPTRMRGYSLKSVLGGAHISPYLYVPFLMNKAMVSTEHDTFEALADGLTMEEIEDYYKGVAVTAHMDRIRNVSDVMRQIKKHYYIPWIMRCAQDRYPSFFGKRDPRLYYPPCFFDFEC